MLTHEHRMEFIKEENGVSYWECKEPVTYYIAYHQPVYFGLCGKFEIQLEDSQP